MPPRKGWHGVKKSERFRQLLGLGTPAKRNSDRASNRRDPTSYRQAPCTLSALAWGDVGFERTETTQAKICHG